MEPKGQVQTSERVSGNLHNVGEKNDLATARAGRAEPGIPPQGGADIDETAEKQPLFDSFVGCAGVSDPSGLNGGLERQIDSYFRPMLECDAIQQKNAEEHPPNGATPTKGQAAEQHSPPLWLPEEEDTDELRFFDFDEHYRKNWEPNVTEHQAETPNNSSGNEVPSAENVQDPDLSCSSRPTTPRISPQPSLSCSDRSTVPNTSTRPSPPVSATSHDFCFLPEDKPEDVPAWMKEENDAVLALAAQNYENFHSLPLGIMKPDDPTTAKILAGTSAGIAGWATFAPTVSSPKASKCSDTSSQDSRHQAEQQKEDKKDYDERRAREKLIVETGGFAGAMGATTGSAPGHARSDEEESRQLRIAMLESVGVRPGCTAIKRSHKEACSDDVNNLLCYYSSEGSDSDDDDERNEDLSTVDDETKDQTSSTKKPRKNEKGGGDSAGGPKDKTACKSSCNGKDGAAISRSTEVKLPTTEAEDFVIIQSPPKVSRSSWQWRNVVRQIRGDAGAHMGKVQNKNKEAIGNHKQDQHRDSCSSDGEWSLVEADK